MLPTRSVAPQPANPNFAGGGLYSRIWTWALSILYIVYSLEVGIALLIFPWWNKWENNYLLYLYPRIRPLVANPFFKGAVLGLGIANILIGIHEIVHAVKKISKGPFSR